MADATSKMCTKCGETKSLDDFYRAKRGALGRHSQCKRCKRARKAEWLRIPEGERQRILLERRNRTTKVCTACGTEKPLTDFRFREDRNHYLSECRPCVSARFADIYARNAERIKDRSRAYHAKNRDLIKAKKHAYHLAHKERINGKSRAWYEQNKERVKASGKQARRDGRAAVWAKAKRLRNPEAERAQRAERRALRRGAAAGAVDLDELWNGACGICGESLNGSLRYPHPRSKSIDHIVPISKGGTHEQSNLQWAHLVCNLRKGDRIA